MLEYGRERPADQCQIVRRVKMWYTSKDIGPYPTCILHTNLKTRFEYGISHLVFLARYYHTNGTKSLRRLRNLSNKHKLSDRNVKRVMSRDCHVINFTFNKIFYIQYCPKLFFIVTRISIDQLQKEDILPEINPDCLLTRSFA